VRIATVAEGLAAPEGPVSVGVSEWLLTEMGTGHISRIGPERGQRQHLAQTGRPNGLAIDGQGAVWIAEPRNASVLRLDPASRRVVTVATAAEDDEEFLWPNDLCFGPDGILYMTDSGVRIEEFESHPPDARHELDLDGRVIAVDPKTRTARILDRGLQFPNGIAIGPDDEFLYVSETLTGIVHRYPIGDISSETRLTFASVMLDDMSTYANVAGPDGMAFDAEGNLLVAVLTQGTLTALNRNGDVQDHYSLPDSFPTNVAFGGADLDTLVVTGAATGVLLTIEWPVSGLALHRPRL